VIGVFPPNVGILGGIMAAMIGILLWIVYGIRRQSSSHHGGSQTGGPQPGDFPFAEKPVPNTRLDVEAARDQVRIPAIGLIVLGVIQCSLFGLVLLVGLLFVGFFFARTAPHEMATESFDAPSPPLRVQEEMRATEPMGGPVPPDGPRPTAVPELTPPPGPFAPSEPATPASEPPSGE
jgi:hypothetical protein